MVSSYMLLKILHRMKTKRRKETTIYKNNEKTSIALHNALNEGKTSLKDYQFLFECKVTYGQNLCRICLKNGDIPIFGLKDLSHDLGFFAGIDLEITDKYPKYLCSSCNTLLEAAIVLRRTAQKTEQVLRRQEMSMDMDSPTIDSYDKSYSNNEENIINDKELNDIDEEDSHIIEGDLINNHQKTRKDEEVCNETNNAECKILMKNDTEFKILMKDDAECKIVKKNKKKKEVIKNYYHCAKCNIFFTTMKAYKKHQKTAGHKSHRDCCPYCKKMYVNLNQHVKIQHVGPKHSFICDICGKTFNVGGLLSRHRVTHFDDHLPFKCSVCPYRGRFRDSLKHHMRTHTGERPYKCPECPYRASCRSNVNKHMGVHKSEYNYKCNDCDKQYRWKDQLIRHIQDHHICIKDQICKICKGAFTTRRTLLKHELKVHKREKLLCGRPLYLTLEAKNNQGNEE